MKAPIVFRRQRLSVEALIRHRHLLDAESLSTASGWSPAQAHAVIGNVINGLSIPPIYLLEIPVNERTRYRVIKGGPHCTALFEFAAIRRDDYHEGVRTASDLVLFEDPSLELAGKTVNEIRLDIPWLYARFLRTELDVTFVSAVDHALVDRFLETLDLLSV